MLRAIDKSHSKSLTFPLLLALCFDIGMENGVILDHGSRFPLVIDPSGSAINFLMKKYKDEKIQSTSFLDKAFTKTLAGAVRFGTTLLVSLLCL